MTYRRTLCLRARWASAICVGAILALGAAGVARADGYDADHHGIYDPRYDENNDGLLDHSERDVMAFDHDRSGYLDWTERRALERHKREMRQSYGHDRRGYSGRYRYTYDRDGYGYVDRHDRRVARRVTRLFQRYDRDRDGALEWHELRRTRLRDRLYYMDMNGNGRAEWHEVERYVWEGRDRRHRHERPRHRHPHRR